MLKRDGFSLIEVLIAMVVLSVGILAVTRMELVSMQSNTRSTSLTSASALARSTMDRLLAANYSHADLIDTDADGAAGLVDATPGAADFHRTEGRYEVFWNVADNVPINNCKTIQVHVLWSAGAQSKSMSFSSVKTR